MLVMIIMSSGEESEAAMAVKVEGNLALLKWIWVYNNYSNNESMAH